MKMEEKLQKLRKTQKKIVVEDESSDDEVENISMHGESSEDEEDFADDQTDGQSRKDPEDDDYVLVKLKLENSENKWVFYVGQIKERIKDEEETCYDVDFYRQSKKLPRRFVKPANEDRAKVMKNEIVMSAQTYHYWWYQASAVNVEVSFKLGGI